MLLSISLIIITGLVLGWVLGKLRMPYIVGMLLAGMLFGPHGFNLLEPTMLSISSDVRKIALIIILVKAGLTLDIRDLQRIGRPAFLLCFLPASCEILAFTLFGPMLLGITRLQAALMGAVMAAVSPAIVVPRLSRLIEEKWGTKKGVPQMLLGGASADDVYAIVVFTALLGLEAGGSFSPLVLLQIPESIILGGIIGFVTGMALSMYFKRVHIRDSLKVTILMAIGMLLYWLESVLEAPVAMSGLLAVMTAGMTMNYRLPVVAARLARKFSKLWVAAEIFLFVLVGASVDIGYAWKASPVMLVLLLLGLCFRLLGARLSVSGTPLNAKEKLFCMLAELPKATVQAAIGGVPLAMGLSCGSMILSFSVIAILITAPLGAKAMDYSYRKLLTRDDS